MILGIGISKQFFLNNRLIIEQIKRMRYINPGLANHLEIFKVLIVPKNYE